VTSTLAPAVIMPHLAPSWVTRFGKVFTGPPRSPTPPTLCGPAGVASSTSEKHLPAHALQSIPITWPFAVWGLDLVGPLKKAPGGFAHLLVVVDKFSKWIEARPIGKIKSEQAVRFFTDIIFRFGVPNSIINDNGTQFTCKKFLAFCDSFHIRVDWSAVAHP